MRIPGPKSILGAGGLTLGVGGVLRSREKKKAKQRVDEFKSDEVKDWDRFTDHAARKSFVQQLGSDPATDPKLLQYADNMNRLKTGSKITSLPGDAGKSYQITKLRGSERLGCTCNDWRYKRSVAQPGEEQDCKHIKQYRQMSKTATATREGAVKIATELKDVPWSKRRELVEKTLSDNLKGTPVDEITVKAQRGFGFLAPNAEIYAKKHGKNVFDEENIFSLGSGNVSLRKDVFRPRWELEANALYLTPEFQGRGIGGSLFKGVLSAAKDLGVDKVTLQADEDGKAVWAKMPGVQFQAADRKAVGPAYARWRLHNKGPDVPVGSSPKEYPEQFLRSWEGGNGLFIGYEIPINKTAAASFKDTLPKPVIDGKPHDGAWTVVGSGRLSIPKKTSDIDYMVPLEEVKDLSSFQEYKDVPGVYWRDSETVDGRPSTIVALPRYAYDKIDASYQQATDRFGRRKLRQMRKSLSRDSFYKDIGVVYTSDAMKKEAGLWGKLTGKDAVDSAIADREKGLQQRRDLVSRLEGLQQRINNKKHPIPNMNPRVSSKRTRALQNQYYNHQFPTDAENNRLINKGETEFMRAYNEAYEAGELKTPLEQMPYNGMGDHYEEFLSPYGVYEPEQKAAIARRLRPEFYEYVKTTEELGDAAGRHERQDQNSFRRAAERAQDRLNTARDNLGDFDAESLSNVEKTTKRMHGRRRLLGAGAALTLVPGSYAAYQYLKNKRKTSADHKESGVLRKEAAEVTSPLKPHQERVLKKLESSDGVIVAHRVGAGKTLTSIAAAVKSGKPIEVVTPASLTPNFEKELKKHVRGEVDARIRSYEMVTKATKDGRGVDPQRFLILDEAHRLRNSSTDMAAAIRPVAAKAHKRLLLTGTAIYNQPADIAPLANIAAGSTVLPQDEAAFNARFIRETQVKPGLIQRLRGVRPGIKKNLQNQLELENALRGRIDLHDEASIEDFPMQIDERVHVPMSAKQKEVYDTIMDAAPVHVRLKIKSGLPPSKQEAKNLNAFVTGARQASLSPRPYSTRMTDEDEAQNTPKIQEAARRLAQMRATDERFRGVVYSNYIDAGLRPYEKALQRQNIPFETLTGSLSAKQKAQLVSNYNSGKTPVLLVSSSGTEGLDLKGTKLVQVLEPHWNNSKIDQVIGRGVRYQSHSHLPEEERKVLVQRFYSSLPKTGIKKLLNLDPGKSTEEWVQDRADEKSQLAAEMRETFLRASGNEKSAGHVEDRVAERAPGAEAEVNTLRSKLRKLRLRKGQTYHVPLSRGKGYAVIGDVGDHHAVKTVLGPNMRPPGERLKLARAPRDYEKEYAQYHSKPEQVENRSLRNQARRKLGLKKGDPREVDHKTPLAKGGGNGHGNLRAVSRTTNRTKFTGDT